MPTRERIQSPFAAAAPAGGSPESPAAPVPAPADPATSSPRLELRALTGWEEEYLERHATQPNTARLCNEILARCLVAPGADADAARATVRGLLVAERDRELVALRRLSLGPDVSGQVPCPECGEESAAEFSLDALPLDFERPPTTVRVEIGGAGEVLLDLPTAGDQEDLADAGLAGDAERRSWLLARCLRRYGGHEGDFDVAFTRGLPVAERAALERAIERSLPDLDLEMAVECSHCGAAIVAPFDVPVFFFFELSVRARGLLRDVHELARAYGWTQADVFALSLGRRLAYRLLLEEDADAALLANLQAQPVR